MTICSHHGGGFKDNKGIKPISPTPANNSKSIVIREASRMANEIVSKKYTFKSEELAKRFEEEFNDPELIALRRPMALTMARVSQLLERVDSGVSDQLWRDALKQFGKLKSAIHGQDETEIQTELSKLDAIFERVMHDYESWSQIFEALELQQKLSESERKRLMEMKAYMSAEEAMKLVSALGAAIYKHVQDPLVIRRILYEFTRLTGGGFATVSSDVGKPPDAE
jgi:hypothetical protein